MGAPKIWSVTAMLIVMLFCSSVGFSQEVAQNSLQMRVNCEQCVVSNGNSKEALTVSDLIEYIKVLRPDVKAVETADKVLITFGKSKLLLRKTSAIMFGLTAWEEKNVDVFVPDSYLEEGMFSGTVSNREYASERIGLIINESEVRMLEQGIESPAVKRKKLEDAQKSSEIPTANNSDPSWKLLNELKDYRVWAVKKNPGLPSTFKVPLESTDLSLGEILSVFSKLYPNVKPQANRVDAKTILLSLGADYFEVIQNSSYANRLDIYRVGAADFIWSLVAKYYEGVR